MTPTSQFAEVLGSNLGEICKTLYFLPSPKAREREHAKSDEREFASCGIAEPDGDENGGLVQWRAERVWE